MQRFRVVRDKPEKCWIIWPGRHRLTPFIRVRLWPRPDDPVLVERRPSTWWRSKSVILIGRQEGEVIEVFTTKRRDRRAALKFLKRTIKRYGRPRSIVTDRLRSSRSAAKVTGNAADRECGRRLNNRAKNSHRPFQRREGAMAKFRGVRTLQNLTAAHAAIHNHLNQNRHLHRRDIF